jgi:hypothetical protein
VITQTVNELVALVIEELEIPANRFFAFQSFAMDFIRQLRIDGRTGILNERREVYYNLADIGYTTVNLPHDYVDYVTVGTQIGRYIKALAFNGHLTDHKFKEQTGLLTRTNNNIWYWGNLWGLGTSLWGPMGQVQAFGNGGDYGDFNIDLANKKLILSPTFAYSNVTLQYISNCLEPSETTTIHPYFIMAFKEFIKYKHFENKGNAQFQVHQKNYQAEYIYAWQRKNRRKTQDIIKIFDRTRGYRNGYY